MKRLTKRNKEGFAYFPQCFEEPCCGFGCQIEPCEFLRQVCEQLAAYEDMKEKEEQMKEAAAVSGMLFPKPEKTKKRKKHKKSIMQPKEDRRCYLCMLLDNDFTEKRCLHEHHVMFGNDHAFAEAEGLKVNLCRKHHQNGPEAVHNNQKNAEILMAKAQEAYERTHSREEWMKNGRKNYL